MIHTPIFDNVQFNKLILESVQNQLDNVQNQTKENEMSSGGRREGAGRKSKFGEKTVVVRVPESMLEFVQNHLIALDNATNSNDYVTESKQLAQIKEIIERYEANYKKAVLNKASDAPVPARWDNAKKLIADLKAVTG